MIYINGGNIVFRNMRRFKQELSKEECIEILKSEPRGVISMIGDDGYPWNSYDTLVLRGGWKDIFSWCKGRA